MYKLGCDELDEPKTRMSFEVASLKTKLSGCTVCRCYTIEAVLVTVMENNLEDDMEDDER